MIFTRLHSSDTIRINKIEIIKPKINKYYEYFYPDGITKGLWKYQKTYFCREILRLENETSKIILSWDRLINKDTSKTWLKQNFPEIYEKLRELEKDIPV